MNSSQSHKCLLVSTGCERQRQNPGISEYVIYLPQAPRLSLPRIFQVLYNYIINPYTSTGGTAQRKNQQCRRLIRPLIPHSVPLSMSRSLGNILCASEQVLTNSHQILDWAIVETPAHIQSRLDTRGGNLLPRADGPDLLHNSVRDIYPAYFQLFDCSNPPKRSLGWVVSLVHYILYKRCVR